jgi:hypothetical protein
MLSIYKVAEAYQFLDEDGFTYRPPTQWLMWFMYSSLLKRPDIQSPAMHAPCLLSLFSSPTKGEIKVIPLYVATALGQEHTNLKKKKSSFYCRFQ